MKAFIELSLDGYPPEITLCFGRHRHRVVFEGKVNEAEFSAVYGRLCALQRALNCPGRKREQAARALGWRAVDDRK